jgi:hypothetical protein
MQDYEWICNPKTGSVMQLYLVAEVLWNHYDCKLPWNRTEYSTHIWLCQILLCEREVGSWRLLIPPQLGFGSKRPRGGSSDTEVQGYTHSWAMINTMEFQRSSMQFRLKSLLQMKILLWVQLFMTLHISLLLLIYLIAVVIVFVVVVIVFAFIMCSVSFSVYVVLCAVFVWVWCVICVLCLIVVNCHRVKPHLQFK